MDAIAVLRIDPAALAAPPPPTGAAPLELRPLDDAVLVVTHRPFGSEPDELSVALRAMLGDRLDAHADPRGVLVFPDVYQPQARRYEALVEEVGELGFRVPVLPAGHVPAPRAAPPAEAPAPSGPEASEDDLADLPPGLPGGIFELMNALPPGLLEQMQQAMATGDQSAMLEISTQLGGVLAQRPELMETLQSTLGDLQDLGAIPAGGMPDLPFDLPDESAAPELWAQARAQLEQLRETDPERFAELEQRLHKK